MVHSTCWKGPQFRRRFFNFCRFVSELVGYTYLRKIEFLKRKRPIIDYAELGNVNQSSN